MLSFQTWLLKFAHEFHVREKPAQIGEDLKYLFFESLDFYLKIHQHNDQAPLLTIHFFPPSSLITVLAPWPWHPIAP
jgi:hypothetical protein